MTRLETRQRAAEMKLRAAYRRHFGTGRSLCGMPRSAWDALLAGITRIHSAEPGDALADELARLAARYRQ